MENVGYGFFYFYTAATGIFFLVQLYGFVISQVRYSDEIEEPKFRMLETEENEWNVSR